jgi:PBP1b-binding outer membrane lipoprotein LpoB
MTIRIIPCALIALILSACSTPAPIAIVIPVPQEMEVEWRAE